MNRRDVVFGLAALIAARATPAAPNIDTPEVMVYFSPD